MGPRKKILVAVADYKQNQQEVNQEGGGANTERVEGADTVDSEIPSFDRRASRPGLRKQSSTEVTAAYHSVSG